LLRDHFTADCSPEERGFLLGKAALFLHSGYDIVKTPSLHDRLGEPMDQGLQDILDKFQAEPSLAEEIQQYFQSNQQQLCEQNATYVYDNPVQLNQDQSLVTLQFDQVLNQPATTDQLRPEENTELVHDSMDTLIEPLGTSGKKTESIPEPTTLGRYEDCGKIAAGGMGEVRRIRDRELNRILAMKLLHPALQRSAEGVARFIEEAQVLAQLQHPNIIPVHEMGSLPDNRLYYTMKEVKGRDLDVFIHAVHQVSRKEQWGETESGWNFRRLIEAFRSVCVAISYAHEKGVIHRDLKPNNIMIGNFGEVLVMDWGLAKIRARDHHSELLPVVTERSGQNIFATQMGRVAGTPAYMPPEQAMGDIDRVDERSDIYSLGAVLYEILTGIPPYQGKSAQDVLSKVLSGPPTSLSRLTAGNVIEKSRTSLPINLENIPHLPQELVRICEKSMMREPTERYQSASEMADTIQSWLEGALRKEKALQLVNQAQEKIKAADQYQLESTAHWKHANQQLAQQGIESHSGWVEWEAAQQSHQSMLDEQREAEQILIAALVQEPTLLEAHRDLSTLFLVQATTAHQKDFQPQKENKIFRIRSHINWLNPDEQHSFNQRISLIDKGHSAQHGRFIGSIDFLETVEGQLDTERIVHLIGGVGAGATRTALEIASRWHKEKPSGHVIFCDVTKTNQRSGLLSEVAAQLSITLSTNPIQQLAESLAAETSCLLMLDGLHEIEAQQSILEPWLEIAPDLQILTTGSTHPSQAHTLSVPKLSLLEAMELFVQKSQKFRPSVSLNKGKRKIICDLVEMLDRLPAAITIATSRLGALSVAELYQRLQDNVHILHATDTLNETLQWSWNILPPQAQQTLAQCTIFRGGFNLSDAEKILDQELLEDLEDLCLLNWIHKIDSRSEEQRYQMPVLINSFAALNLDVQTNNQLQIKHAAHYRTIKTIAQRKSAQYRLNYWDLVRQDQENLIAAIHHGKTSDAMECYIIMTDLIEQTGPISTSLNLVDILLNNRQDLPPENRVTLLNHRGIYLRILGELDAAKEALQQSITLQEQLSLAEDNWSQSQWGEETLNTESPSKLDNNFNPFQEGQIKKVHSLRQMGLLLRDQGDVDQALEHFQEALTLAKVLKLTELESYLVGDIGIAYHNQGKYAEALKYYKESLINQRKNNTPNLGTSLSNIGFLLMHNGEHQEGLSYIEEALETFNNNNNLQGEGILLGNLGQQFADRGEFEKASNSFERAIQKLRDYGDLRYGGIIMGNFGMMLQKMGEVDRAKTLLRNAAEIHHDVSNKPYEANVLYSLGLLLHSQSDIAAALDCFSKAANCYQDLGEREYRAQLLSLKAWCFENLGQPAAALKTHWEALALYEELEPVLNKGVVHGNIGILLFQQEEYQPAIEHLQQGIEICDQGLPDRSAIFRSNLALTYAKQEHYSQAEEIIQQGLELCNEEQLRFQLLNAGIQVSLMKGDVQATNNGLLEIEGISKSLGYPPDLESTIKDLYKAKDSKEN
jgi:serine/threonine protein kinase/tetratricopeptide (TPR) repeat protein